MRRRRRDAMQSSRCRRAGRGPVWLRRVLQVLRHLRNLRNGSVSRMRKLQVPAGSRDSNEEMPFCPLSSSALRPVRCSRQVTPQFALRRAPTPDIYCFGSFRILVRRSPSTRSRCRRRNSLPFAQMDFVDRAASRQRMLLNHLRPVSCTRCCVYSQSCKSMQQNCPGAELHCATDTGDGPGSGGCLPAAGAPQSIACMPPQCCKVRAHDCCPARSGLSHHQSAINLTRWEVTIPLEPSAAEPHLGGRLCTLRAPALVAGRCRHCVRTAHAGVQGKARWFQGHAR